VVERCLLPDLDILLPKMSSNSESERLFVAAFANEEGTGVLANRIREQLARVPDIRLFVSFSVFHTMLGPVPMRQGDSTQQMLESVAKLLEESMKSQMVLSVESKSVDAIAVQSTPVQPMEPMQV
jgi:hypothetical protein